MKPNKEQEPVFDEHGQQARRNTTGRSCCDGQNRIAEARDAAAERRAGEPSPEAKQAAVWAGYPEQYAALHRAFCEGYDTAMAKAREELDVARAELHRRANECAKLREELAQRETAKALYDRLAFDLGEKCPKCGYDSQLAHQQPSAPTCNCVEQGYPVPECKWHGEAPTADVRELRDIIRHWQQFAAKLSQMLACSSVDEDILAAVKKLTEKQRLEKPFIADLKQEAPAGEKL